MGDVNQLWRIFGEASEAFFQRRSVALLHPPRRFQGRGLDILPQMGLVSAPQRKTFEGALSRRHLRLLRLLRRVEECSRVMSYQWGSRVPSVELQRLWAHVTQTSWRRTVRGLGHCNRTVFRPL
jgi:hypothetical protein